MSNVIRKNASLAAYTTIRVGGPARFFVSAESGGDIGRAVMWAHRHRVPLFFLAGGSNVLFPDAGFPGLVVHLAGRDYAINDDGTVVAGAGVEVQTLVDETVVRGLQGLEWAGGLPGTLGGAIRGNAGAFGGEIKDDIVTVDAINRNDAMNNKGGVMDVRRFAREECEFAYRTGFFKKNPEWVIVEARLQLTPGGDPVALRTQVDDHIRYRREHHPQEPNAGSMFKNIIVMSLATGSDSGRLQKSTGFPESNSIVATELPKEFLEQPSVQNYGKLAAGYIIERCGLKGRCMGSAQISEKHANHVINLGGARARDVLALLEMAEQAATEQFKIRLEREIHVV